MRKVYFLLQHLCVGGVEICVLNVANALASRGYDVTLLCLLKENELSYRVHKDINVVYLTSLHGGGHSLIYKALRRCISYFALCAAIVKLKESVIISTRNEYSVLLSKFARKDNLKIAQLHHDYKARKGIEDDFKYKYANIDYFVLLTDDVRTEIEAIMKNHNIHTNYITIPNFFPDIHIPSSKGTCRKPLAIAVGRLAPEKGFLRLLDAWALVQDKVGCQYQLYIIGDGKERSSIESKIKDLGLQATVRLLGQLPNEDLQTLMQEAKVYCMSSYTESFGMVLLEALHNGLPQVAYDVRVGPRNLIQNEVTGYLIPDGDKETFALKIIQLFTDAERWEKMSLACKNRALVFSEKNVIALWEKIVNT